MIEKLPPSSVRVGPYTYSVHVDAETHRQGERDINAMCYGTTRHFEAQITLSPSMTDDQARETLLHEVLHCVFLVTNTKVKDEEALIRSISPMLTDVLQRNPELVAFVAGT